METLALRELLEDIYRTYNRRDFVHPDPLEFLYRYEKIEDREIAGLVASGLAYGRVALILKNVDVVLGLLGPSPSEFLGNVDPGYLQEELAGFRHRFTTGSELAHFLLSVYAVQKEYGLAGNCLEYLSGHHSYPEALDLFSIRLLAKAGKSYLMPRPSLGSACKRLHLFMRWMVRIDDVDPGGWNMISRADLVVPVDVHMLRVGKCLGFTDRRTADVKTAMEITRGFREFCPEDPVKYDFSLTRFGIQRLNDCSLFRKLFS